MKGVAFMDDTAIRNIIGAFDKNAFQSFFDKLVLHFNGGISVPKKISDNIWASQAERFIQSEQAFFLNYCPTQIYRDFSLKHIDIQSIKNLIDFYRENKPSSPWLPIDGTEYFIINNFDSRRMGIEDLELVKFYEESLLRQKVSDLPTLGVGNINTFLTASSSNFEEISNIINDFFKSYTDGVSICVSEDKIDVSDYVIQSEFSGVTQSSHHIVQPSFKLLHKRSVLEELGRILNSDVQERILEEFLQEHYRDIFGNHYDKIATQLWLKFPELDIGNKDRRMDLFMRNSVSDDWEMYELKRANVIPAKNVRGVPMFTDLVYQAIAQAKNYKALLQQDAVKRKFAQEGIEYFEPEINIIVGKKSEISTAQWRRMIADHRGDVKIRTYDEFFKEASYRSNLY